MKDHIKTSHATYNGREIKVHYHGQMIHDARYLDNKELCSIDSNDWPQVIKECEARR